jgi:hypothetical protein
MNELKGKQGLKLESLIYFHRASLHTDFPFRKPQALTTNLRDYLTISVRSRGLPLFSNLQSGGVIQQKWSGVCVSGVECESTEESAAEGWSSVCGIRSDVFVFSFQRLRGAFWSAFVLILRLPSSRSLLSSGG